MTKYHYLKVVVTQLRAVKFLLVLKYKTVLQTFEKQFLLLRKNRSTTRKNGIN